MALSASEPRINCDNNPDESVSLLISYVADMPINQHNSISTTQNDKTQNIIKRDFFLLCIS